MTEIYKVKWAIIILFIFLSTLSISCSQSPADSPSVSKTQKDISKAETTYKMGNFVSVGYMTYLVGEAGWANRLKEYKPDATFLIIGVWMLNNDKEPRMVPPFKLIDENGLEYQTCEEKAWVISNNIGPLTTLNPGVRKVGVAIFDIHKNKKYKLKVEGGYWSKEHAYIEIIPTEKIKRQR